MYKKHIKPIWLFSKGTTITDSDLWNAMGQIWMALLFLSRQVQSNTSKNHYFEPLFQCVHKCLHNPHTAAVRTTHATSISNPNRGGCMENWGVYAKPYVPCPWIIKLVLLEQRDLWRRCFTGLLEAGLYTTAAPHSFSAFEAYLVHLSKQEAEFGPTLS